MNKKVSFLLLLSISLFLTGCEDIDFPEEGFIYYGCHTSKIYKTDLETGEEQIAFRARSPIRYFIVLKGRILYSESRSNDMVLYDFSLNKAEYIEGLSEACQPLYFRENNILVYSHHERGLVKKDLNSGNEKVLIPNKAKNTEDTSARKTWEITYKCKIDENRFAVHRMSDHAILIYDLNNDSIEDINLYDYYFFDYCPNNNSLIVRKRGEREKTFFFNLETRTLTRMKIKRSKAVRGFICVPELHGVFFAKMRLITLVFKHDIWFYDVNTDKEMKINTEPVDSLSNIYYYETDVLGDLPQL